MDPVSLPAWPNQQAGRSKVQSATGPRREQTCLSGEVLSTDLQSARQAHGARGTFSLPSLEGMKALENSGSGLPPPTTTEALAPRDLVAQLPPQDSGSLLWPPQRWAGDRPRGRPRGLAAVPSVRSAGPTGSLAAQRTPRRILKELPSLMRSRPGLLPAQGPSTPQEDHPTAGA